MSSPLWRKILCCQKWRTPSPLLASCKRHVIFRATGRMRRATRAGEGIHVLGRSARMVHGDNPYRVEHADGPCNLIDELFRMNTIPCHDDSLMRHGGR